MPQRLALLERWLAEICGPGLTLSPASADASFRRYFRVSLPDGETRIAMDAPPDREAVDRFIERAEMFRELGVHVPRVYAVAPERGFALLEDLGSRHYLDELNPATAERLYGDALSTLMAIQAHGPREGLPCYDRPLLERELGIFTEWLLERHLGLELSSGERAMLADTFEVLVQNALEQPQVLVHRDFHSRNLLLSSAPTPGVIDFQDAVVGPVTYDLVSLLRDCYIAWPQEQVDAWAWGYFELAVRSGVLRPEHERSFLRWFDLMGVQRHLKAAGIFARLLHRDGKEGYLADVPRTLGYVVQAGSNHVPTARLSQWLDERVVSKVQLAR